MSHDAAPESESHDLTTRLNRIAWMIHRNGSYGKWPNVTRGYVPEDEAILRSLEQKANAAPESESVTERRAIMTHEAFKRLFDRRGGEGTVDHCEYCGSQADIPCDCDNEAGEDDE